MLKFSPCERKLYELTNFAPPIGRYDPVLPSSLPAIHFHKQARFPVVPEQDEDNITPGPAYYFKNKQTLPNIQRGVLFKSSSRDVAVVPSIPSISSYIYEDIGNGMIVSVKLPEYGVGDRKGKPLENPKPKKQQKPVKKSKAKLAAPLTSIHDGPVDGCMEVHPVTLKPHANAKTTTLNNESTKMESEISMDVTRLNDVSNSQHSLFENNQTNNQTEELETVGIERLMQLAKLLTKDHVPGPGKYQLKGCLKGWTGAKNSSNSEKRFVSLPWAKPNENPGPGCYSLPEQTQNQGVKINQANRFSSQQPTDLVPGPGAYTLPSLATGRLKSVQNLEFEPGFGSGAKRFNYLDKRGKSMPGPGAYNVAKRYQKERKRVVYEDIMIKPSDIGYQDINLIFTNEIRDPSKKETIQNKQNSENGQAFKKKQQMTSVFVASPRFKEIISENDGYLGPGYYDIKETCTKFNRKGNYFGLEQRC